MRKNKVYAKRKQFYGMRTTLPTFLSLILYCSSFTIIVPVVPVTRSSLPSQISSTSIQTLFATFDDNDTTHEEDQKNDQRDDDKEKKLLLDGSYDDRYNLDRFQASVQSIFSSKLKIQEDIMNEISRIGFESCDELESCFFSSNHVNDNDGYDTSDNSLFISSVLIQDFGVSPLLANHIRTALNHMMRLKMKKEKEEKERSFTDDVSATQMKSSVGNLNKEEDKSSVVQSNKNTELPTLSSPYRSFAVNEKAKIRRKNSNDYSLPKNFSEIYPKLASELNDFYDFMINPMSILNNIGEPPLRKPTANVYLKHAKLFIGWYLNIYITDDSELNSDDVSIYKIIYTQERASAKLILSFILFLREERQVSASYEANVLRGILKLVKFRFMEEQSFSQKQQQQVYQQNEQKQGSMGSQQNQGQGVDIPLILEIRKLHRDATRRQNLAPKSSNEDRKWLDWEEYLKVVNSLKQELWNKRETFHESYKNSTTTTTSKKKSETLKKQIAKLYQHYLILAFFSCVPDRQRTIRELEIGRTFVRIEDTMKEQHQSNSEGEGEEKNFYYVIKHSSEDYKTGKTYGDRPPLMISSQELVQDIDDFVTNWREALNPQSNHLFVQPLSGNPMTENSVYLIVSGSCYKYTGKKTNPHLLRDMIVTHIRKNTNASEKELEALALYMGHSLQMQRQSYDRRTFEQKVKPAIDLLQNVNVLKS